MGARIALAVRPVGARWGRALGYVTAGLGVTGLAIMAASAQPATTAALVLLDIAVGLAFVMASATATGARRLRVLVFAIGVVWLIGSIVPTARLAHETLLAVALTLFPRGAPRGAAEWMLVVLAAPVALLIVPQPVVAVLFLTIAAKRAVDGRVDPPTLLYPAAAAGAIAIVLGSASILRQFAPDSFDPVAALVAYEVVLIGAAIGFPVATRVAAGRRGRMLDRMLSVDSVGDRLEGLRGLEAVLQRLFDDTSLRVHRWDASTGTNRQPEGGPVLADGDGGRWLLVDIGGQPIAAVSHRSPAMDDPVNSTAVADAVRLAVRNLEWQARLDVQLSELEAARMRLISATDRQREETAARLRRRVLEPLQRGTAELRELPRHTAAPDAAEALAVVVQELDHVADELIGLVGGIPSEPLGEGRLVEGIRRLAARSPIPVRFTADADVAAAEELERTLYYVCAEAITNAIKHASATELDVALRRNGSDLELDIRDDGVGGADARGTGLQGLADRLAAHGGRLDVVSPPRGGTHVTARLPVSRSSATARSSCRGRRRRRDR